MKRTIITIISCVVIWGITYALWMSDSGLAGVTYFLCAFFGWRALNKIQPSMFLWMSFAGWIVYFFVKFILSALIGFFVAPFEIGKKLGAHISDSI